MGYNNLISHILVVYLFSREIPENERKTVSQMIEQLFTCDFGNLMTESLINEFWYKFKHTEAAPFGKCLKNLKVRQEEGCAVNGFSLPTPFSNYTIINF